MTKIKICGIKTEEHAVAVAEAGADFLGMVFAPSPRQINQTQAKKIALALHSRNLQIQKVGVFVNTPLPTILRIADTCALDWIQLSGDEPWAFCRELKRPIIKVVRVSRNYRAEDIAKHLEYSSKRLGDQQHIFMLDSNAREKYGGTGTRFNWKLAAPITQKFPVIVAGGLKPDNVTQAIEILSPWGVDVSSGVETKGAKDLDKIHKFIDNVRKYHGQPA